MEPFENVYTERESTVDEQTDIVLWMKAELRDMFMFELLNTVDGPALFGNGTDEVTWVVYRDTDDQWVVRERTKED